MKEKDIRPEKLLNHYLKLSREDAEVYFENVDRYSIPCVGCTEVHNTFQFEKNGFHYTKCDSCDSLYQSPRPAIEVFEAFYKNSKSSIFWAEEFFPVVAEARREKIFKPRVKKLTDFFEKKY